MDPLLLKQVFHSTVYEKTCDKKPNLNKGINELVLKPKFSLKSKGIFCYIFRMIFLV